MKTQVAELVGRLAAFNNELIAFVTEIPAEKWHLTCDSEGWTVGVVARHIGSGHYATVQLCQMIVAGKPLPEVTMAQIIQAGNDHARKHADCSKKEVLTILEGKGRAMIDFVAGLDDEDLNRTGYLAEFGGNVSVQQLLKLINLKSAGEHLASMRQTIEMQ
ncbi:MAG: hypothetical protein VR64_10055 [Desulfatitalea sp. BRH_c12]|nr:MAG: hypothetical protein VR64_10055 [Desulfatitalea sp. BRH_c12]